jgi:hypothetical protein
MCPSTTHPCDLWVSSAPCCCHRDLQLQEQEKNQIEEGHARVGGEGTLPVEKKNQERASPLANLVTLGVHGGLDHG